MLSGLYFRDGIRNVETDSNQAESVAKQIQIRRGQLQIGLRMCVVGVTVTL